MQLFYDFFPIIVFFIAYKIWGIYVATAAAIIIDTNFGRCFRIDIDLDAYTPPPLYIGFFTLI